MKINFIHTLVLTFLLMNCCNQAMPQNSGTNMTQVLTTLGFENVHVIMKGDTLKLAYENNIYRWDVRGLAVILDTIVNRVPPETHLEVVTLNDGIPDFKTEIIASDWFEIRNGNLSGKELDDKLQLTYLTDSPWKELKKAKGSNPDLFKFEFIIYPQIYIQNIYFNKIYETQFNIAPALEFSLWKGNKFTGQVIFPLYNDHDLNIQGNYIRPGFLTLSQQFRLPGPFFGSITLGKFNADRYGIDLSFSHPFKNPHWDVSGNVGLTSWTYFYDGILYMGTKFTTSFHLNASYYYQRFNMQFDLSGGRYLYGDYGLRVDCTRHFGETAIGLYGMYSGGKANGGFHFAVPLPPGKRGKRKHVRIYPPRYFDWEYNAAASFTKGRSYKSSPDENRSQNYFNLIYIKNSLH